MAEIQGHAPETCGNCNAWLQQDVDEASGKMIGICQAHPPRPMYGAHFNQPGSGTPQLSFHQPQTLTDDWCREWEAITGPSPL